MPRGVSKRASSVLLLTSLLFCASVGDAQTVTAEATQEGIAPLQCIFESVGTIDVRTASRHTRGRRALSQIEHLVERRILFEPITSSLARVRTLEGDPRTVGDARQPWTMYLAVPFESSGVRVMAGAQVLRFAVREDALVADLDLGNGVVMRSARIPCVSLTLQPSAPATLSTPDSRRLYRHARTPTLSLRARGEQGIEAVRLLLPRALAWEELGRREPFVHVRAALPYATVDGWASDSDLVP